jgi:hypothetical protein
MSNVTINRDTFRLMNTAEFDWILSNHRSNDFASSLLKQIDRRGELSDKQVAAVTRNLERKPVERCVHDFSNIVIIFERTMAKGAKKPIIRVAIEGEVFKFSVAPLNGKNAGCFYIKHCYDDAGYEEQDYVGKINAQGEFHPLRDLRPELIALLAKVNEDFVTAVRDYGTVTGRCGFCALQLTDRVSIALNYGPICADNYGLPHNETVAKMARPDLFVE